jgi:hypothetical protein
MITLLPYPPRRSWLIAFLASISVIVGASMSILLYFFLDHAGVALGIAAGLLFTACGLSLEIISLLYRAYNKVARVFAAWTVTWTSVVCYFVVFQIMSCFGSDLNVEPETRGKSNWLPVNSVTAMCGFEDGSLIDARRGWIGNYLAWCMRSRNLWALCLLPFLFVLSLVDCSAEYKSGAVSESIYTLY